MLKLFSTTAYMPVMSFYRIKTITKNGKTYVRRLPGYSPSATNVKGSRWKRLEHFASQKVNSLAASIALKTGGTCSIFAGYTWSNEKEAAMKSVAVFLMMLVLPPAMAQDNKYVGTGMSVTGPASEKKAPAPVKTTTVKSDEPNAIRGAHGTSEEEVSGTNSATTNSH